MKSKSVKYWSPEAFPSYAEDKNSINDYYKRSDSGIGIAQMQSFTWLAPSLVRMRPAYEQMKAPAGMSWIGRTPQPLFAVLKSWR